MYGGELLSLVPGEEPRVEYRQRGFLGGIGWPAGSGPVVASKLDRKLVNADGEVLAELPGGDSPINEAIALPDGSMLVGEYGFDLMRGAKFAPGRLFRVKQDVEAEVVCEGLAFPNGMALSPDGDILYLAETMSGRISRIALGLDGTFGERQTFAELGKGQPDGLDCDRKGRVWIACRGGDEVVCLDPDGAEIKRIHTPRKPADVCVSADGASLYVAISSGTAEDLSKDPVPRTGQVIRYHIN